MSLAEHRSAPEADDWAEWEELADELDREGNESEDDDGEEGEGKEEKKSCPKRSRGPANHTSPCYAKCSKVGCKRCSGSTNNWDNARVGDLTSMSSPPLFSPPPVPKFTEAPDVEHYCAKGVYIWAPLDQFPGCYRCKECNQSIFSHKGYSTRYIHGIDCGVLLVCRRYACATCSKVEKEKDLRFFANEAFLQQLPEYVQAMFPCVITEKSGATKELVRTATMLFSLGLSIGKICGFIRKKRIERWVSKASDYMNHVCYWKESGRESGTLLAYMKPSSSSNASPIDTTFPQLMEHCKGYNEMAGISHSFLRQLVQEEILRVKPHADAIMAGVTGASFAFDQTHTVASRVHVRASGATSEQPFDNLIAIVNEKSMIANYAFCSSTEHSQQQNMIKSIQKRGCTPQMYCISCFSDVIDMATHCIVFS